MIIELVRLWYKNKARLEEAISKAVADGSMDTKEYLDIVKMTFQHIVNGEADEYDVKIDADGIREIDNGDYQGTYLYTIPAKCYQPGQDDYLLTFVNYGSCSGCDTLERIKCDIRWEYKSEEAGPDYMKLCKDLITNAVKPYSGGRSLREFDEQAKWDKFDDEETE